MKARQPHIMPLSSQVMTLLRDLQPLTGASPFLLTSRAARSRARSWPNLEGFLRERLPGFKHLRVASAMSRPIQRGRALHDWARFSSVHGLPASNTAHHAQRYALEVRLNILYGNSSPLRNASVSSARPMEACSQRRSRPCAPGRLLRTTT